METAQPEASSSQNTKYAGVIFGICVVFGMLRFENYLTGSLGSFLGYTVASFILIPLGALVALFIQWLGRISSPPTTKTFGHFLCWGVAITAVGFLVVDVAVKEEAGKTKGLGPVVAQQTGAPESVARPPKPPVDLKKVVLFDTTMRVSKDPFDESKDQLAIRTRIRNETDTDITNIVLVVAIVEKGAGGKLIEAEDVSIWIPGTAYSIVIPSAYAKSVDFSIKVNSLPRDYDWGLVVKSVDVAR